MVAGFVRTVEVFAFYFLKSEKMVLSVQSIPVLTLPLSAVRIPVLYCASSIPYFRWLVKRFFAFYFFGLERNFVFQLAFSIPYFPGLVKTFFPVRCRCLPFVRGLSCCRLVWGWGLAVCRPFFELVCILAQDFPKVNPKFQKS